MEVFVVCSWESYYDESVGDYNGCWMYEKVFRTEEEATSYIEENDGYCIKKEMI